MERLTKWVDGEVQPNHGYKKRLTKSGREIDADVSDREIKQKLAAYEDAEERGLLVRLPCKVGDSVYKLELRNKCAGCKDGVCLSSGKRKLYNGKCTKSDEWCVVEIPFTLGCLSSKTLKLGRSVYTARADAEAELERSAR